MAWDHGTHHPNGVARTGSKVKRREEYQSVKGSSADTSKTFFFEEPLCAAAETTVVKASQR